MAPYILFGCPGGGKYQGCAKQYKIVPYKMRRKLWFSRFDRIPYHIVTYDCALTALGISLALAQDLVAAALVHGHGTLGATVALFPKPPEDENGE